MISTLRDVSAIQKSSLVTRKPGRMPSRRPTLTPVRPRVAQPSTAPDRRLTCVRTDTSSIEASIVGHAYSTLARAAYNVDDLAMYQATALSVRDLLIKQWNETQIYHTTKKPKSVAFRTHRLGQTS